MAAAHVFLLEQPRSAVPTFGPALEKRGYRVTVETSVQKAIKQAPHLGVDIVVLQAASFKTSGARICRQLKAGLADTPLIVIADKKNLPDANCGADLVLVLPFTPRKLNNGIVRLLPGDDTGAVQVGPIKLNLAQRRIACNGREQKVTPKQARLLEIFLRAPGQVITRKQIIKYVWETDYTGDTRTLDVHISWLRNVLEPDPRHPRYLKTLRGEGYRLDLPEEDKGKG